MFYDGLPLEFFPILIHRYNSFNRQLKGLYCLIFSFNLNFTVSSLRRNSKENLRRNYLLSLSKQTFAASLTRDLSTFILFFCRKCFKACMYGMVVMMLYYCPMDPQFEPRRGELIFFILYYFFRIVSGFFEGSFWISQVIFLNFTARLLTNSKNITCINWAH